MYRTSKSLYIVYKTAETGNSSKENEWEKVIFRQFQKTASVGEEIISMR